MRVIWILLVILAGCGLVGEGQTPSMGASMQAERVEPENDTAEGRETLETEGQAVKGPLGRTVASLGNAAEPGLWLKTPLVPVQGPGHVRNPVTGLSVAVTLIPLQGPATGGSQLSLEAMRALGIPLTDLPEIEVRAGA